MFIPVRRVPRRAACILLLITQFTACRTWSRVPGTVEQQAGTERIPQARLILRNGAELPLRDVTVGTDSVVGFLGDARERRAVAITDVAAIDRRHFSVARTSGLVVGTAVIGFVVLLGVAIGSLAGNIGVVPAPGTP